MSKYEEINITVTPVLLFSTPSTDRVWGAYPSPHLPLVVIQRQSMTYFGLTKSDYNLSRLS